MISENGAQLEYHGSNRETSNPSAHPPLTTTSIAPSPAETRGSWPVSGVQGFTTYCKRVPDYARSSARPRGFAESRASLRGARASSPRAGSRRFAPRCTSFERARHDGRHGQSWPTSKRRGWRSSIPGPKHDRRWWAAGAETFPGSTTPALTSSGYCASTCGAGAAPGSAPAAGSARPVASRARLGGRSSRGEPAPRDDPEGSLPGRHRPGSGTLHGRYG